MCIFTLRNGLRALGLAVALAAVLPSSALAATVSFRIERTSANPEALTFSGTGTVTFTGPADDPADIEALSLRIGTIGEDFGGSEITHLFDYAAADIVAVSGLVATGSGIAGSILFEGKESTTGEAFMDDLFLDFGAGAASGFCFASGSGEEQCIFGGGTSSTLKAKLRVSPVPLPASLPLIVLAVGGLAGLARVGRTCLPR